MLKPITMKYRWWWDSNTGPAFCIAVAFAFLVIVGSLIWGHPHV